MTRNGANRLDYNELDTSSDTTKANDAPYFYIKMRDFGATHEATKSQKELQKPIKYSKSVPVSAQNRVQFIPKESPIGSAQSPDRPACWTFKPGPSWVLF